MSALLEIHEDWHDDVPVLRLEGEIDVSNVDEIRGRMRELVTNREFALIVDLTPTSYLDSAGINLLFAIGEEMRGRQQQLHVVLNERSPLTRMVSLTGLDKSLPMHSTLERALAATARRS
jgi:anti-sigma B factor antagonist